MSEYNANINRFTLANNKPIKQRIVNPKRGTAKSGVTYLGMIKGLIGVFLGVIIAAEVLNLNIVLF